MDTATAHELVGYLASALVVLSLVMSSVLRLRLIGLAGALVFAVYGLLIGALPIVVTNGAILVVHAVHLRRLLHDRAADAYFEVVRWPVDGVYLPRFLERFRSDIHRSQPSFRGLQPDHLAWVVLRDAEPVGVLLARRLTDGHAHLDLDYVTPAHRDLRAGSAVFGDPTRFVAEGITRLTTDADTDLHRRYLARMGFAPEPQDPSVWGRQVD
jgi:hypothetical protein